MAAQQDRSAPLTISVNFADLAKMIDHSLLHPTMTDDETAAGIVLAKVYDVATVCIKPYAIPQAKQLLAGSSVKICAVVGFPHGNNTTDVKVYETTKAVEAGAVEIDVVVNIGKALGGDWDYISSEIKAVNDVVIARGAILKVIFENDFLDQAQKEKLCDICSRIGVAFVKTSTGYGFVKQPNGYYSYRGATLEDLATMRRLSHGSVQVKAAGGIRTLDDLIKVRALGVSRVGATATETILEEARKRGIGSKVVDVPVPQMEPQLLHLAQYRD